ncbi:MAG: ABC transporter ATP-binding protein [Dehalococcoidia bacterium]
MANAVVLENIHKRFTRTAGYRDIILFWRRTTIDALNGVDLTVPEGAAFGLLGPNGAGKTTLLKILAGLVIPTEGTVRILGQDVTGNPALIRKKLMYVTGEERTLYWRLTGRQNLRFYANLFEVPQKKVMERVEEVLEIVDLQDASEEPVMKYSTGMKHRLAIARGLLADPQILLLDEPTRSLDPLSARRLWIFIKDVLIKQLNRTIIIATHNMEEASYLCSQVAVMDKGVVKACDTAENLSRSLDRRRCRITVDGISQETITALRSSSGVHDLLVQSPNGHRQYTLEMSVDDPETDIPIVVDQLVRSGGRVSQVVQQQGSLTDVIVELSERSR